MIFRFAPVIVTLTLAACGSTPDAPDPDRILIVPAKAANAVVSGGRISGPGAPSAVRTPTLTVEETARLNTSEMWSEPIAADAEEMVIE